MSVFDQVFDQFKDRGRTESSEGDSPSSSSNWGTDFSGQLTTAIGDDVDGIFEKDSDPGEDGEPAVRRREIIDSIKKMNEQFFSSLSLPAIDNHRDLEEEPYPSAGGGFTREPKQMDNATFGVTESPLFPSINSSLAHNTWMVPMLTLSSINVLVIVTFEIYVICQASRHTPSRRHLFLGQMLLLGLFLGSVVGFAYAVSPDTAVSCAVIRLGTGVAYALIYSSLLVKLVFLISLNTGVYLPATYQALLFLFCILPQLVIGLQWVLSSAHLCAFTTRDHVLSLLYVIFLIVFSSSLAVKARHFRDNYREARYIGGLMTVTVPLWLAWIIASVVVKTDYHPALVGFSLLIICAVTFMIMFLPKSRQLSAIGKEGIYLEDQEDGYSINSGQRGYSPSFYHSYKTYTKSGGGSSSLYKDHSGREESPFYRLGNSSYTGFHRPSRVVPPSAANTSSQPTTHEMTPPPQPQGPPPQLSARLLPNSQHNHQTFQRNRTPSRIGGVGNMNGGIPTISRNNGGFPQAIFAPPPPPYTRNIFPSHFFPEKMHHYWQYYYPRIPAMYGRDPEMDIYPAMYSPPGGIRDPAFFQRPPRQKYYKHSPGGYY